MSKKLKFILLRVLFIFLGVACLLSLTNEGVLASDFLFFTLLVLGIVFLFVARKFKNKAKETCWCGGTFVYEDRTLVGQQARSHYDTSRKTGEKWTDNKYRKTYVCNACGERSYEDVTLKSDEETITWK